MEKILKEYNSEYLALPEEEKGVLCPRCGRNRLNKQPVHNALSKHPEGIYICSLCGVDEDVLDMFKRSLPLEKWWAITDWRKNDAQN